MSVRKRSWGSGKEAWIVDYRDGSGVRRLKTFARKKEADAFAAQAAHEVRQGTHAPDSASVTFGDAAALWIAKGAADGRERSTLAQRRQHLAHLEPIIGREKLSRLTTPRLEVVRDTLVAKMSRPTARKVLGSIKAVLSEAQRRGLVAMNSAAPVRIDVQARHRKRVVIPSKAEVKAMIDAADGRWRPFLIVAAFTGLRASELRGLRWHDVDIDGRLLHVEQRADRYRALGSPKSRAGTRTIPLSPLVVNTLREWRLACPKGELDLVFPNGAGHVEELGNIHRRGYAPIQQRALGEVKYTLHALRHFYASAVIELGFAPKKVQAMMGHSSITMTFDLYGHLFPDEQSDVDRMALLAT